MVECEYARKWLLIDIIKGFNRYMVECESKNNQTETNARELF